jgi:plastocyanin
MIILILLFSLFFAPTPLWGAEAQTYEVTILPNILKFDPDKITIKAGDTIRWHNKDERKHVLASVPGSGPTDDLEIFSDEFRPGTVYSHTFKDPGEYPYFCFIHNKMTGMITVLEREKQP